MTWRITGQELLTVDKLGAGPRRHADASWDGTGLLAAPGSELVIAKLRALHGGVTRLDLSAVAPGPFTLDLRDRAPAYWANVSLL